MSLRRPVRSAPKGFAVRRASTRAGHDPAGARERSGLSQQAICYIERGVCDAKPTSIWPLAEALDTAMGAPFGFGEDEAEYR